MAIDPPTRRVARFAWEEVDKALLRAMLVERYRADGRDQDIAALDRIDDESISEQAVRSLGQPLDLRHMRHLVDVLRTRWLPQLGDDVLAELCESVKLGLHGDPRRQRTRTPRQQLEFLQQRNNTDNLQRNLRSWFLKLHKTHADVPVRPRGEPMAAAAIELLGQGEPRAHRPYQHQRDAWQRLDELADGPPASHRGLLVLPTGAGKTWTAVAWLMSRLDADPALRVLWLAEQQELVDQAARAFEVEARTKPPAFRRRLRIVHSNASPPTVLADNALDVVCATRQSITGRKLDAATRNRLRRFLSRPTIVVVDEAHHIVAASYQKLLGLIEELRPQTLTLGLTATPWPQGAGMTAKLVKTLPVRVAEVQVRDLVKQEILARPQLHVLDTRLRIDLDSDELTQAKTHDLPPSVLRRLDRVERNTLVVETYQAGAERWGKTLVFACDIDHADSLHKTFQDKGIESTVLHSRIDGDR